MNVRVRFAPSPTGHLHIGNLRAAIFNWLFAKHKGGKFLLRIEDTDVVRSKKEYVDSILKSLEWLRLISDEEPLFQMSRSEEHKKAVNVLLEKGLAYPCFCEPKSMDAVGKKYSGFCRDKEYTEEDLKKPYAIRFKLPRGDKITFKDVIRGMVTVGYDQLDDFVIVRRGGIPTYNFVVVLDDIYMRITHVIRGDDHISNTPKQILLYDALGGKIPVFAHLPLILGQSGAPLSKRDATTSVNEYKSEGYLPDALFNYLVRLGWAHGNQEIFSREELINLFTLEKVGKKGAVFDIKKLRWLNGVYIRELTLESFLTELKDSGSDLEKKLHAVWQEKLAIVFKLYQERAETLNGLANDILELNQDPDDLNLDLIKKWHSKNTYMLVRDFIEQLEVLEHIHHDELLVEAKKACEAYGSKLVELAQAIRLALCGKVQSPGVFDVIVVLGKEKTIERLKKLLEKLRIEEKLMISQ